MDNDYEICKAFGGDRAQLMLVTQVWYEVAQSRMIAAKVCSLSVQDDGARYQGILCVDSTTETSIIYIIYTQKYSIQATATTLRLPYCISSCIDG